MWSCDWFWLMWYKQRYSMEREGAAGPETRYKGWSSIRLPEPWSGLEGGSHVLRWQNVVANGILRLSIRPLDVFYVRKIKLSLLFHMVSCYMQLSLILNNVGREEGFNCICHILYLKKKPGDKNRKNGLMISNQWGLTSFSSTVFW